MDIDDNKTESSEKKTFTKNAQSGNKKFGEKTDEFRTAAYRA